MLAVRCTILVFFAAALGQCYAATREYNLTVAPGWLAPDGYWRKVWTVNGQTPGPPIECDEGDTLRINVHNTLPVDITMHYHGLLQRKPWYDGVPGVTQYPILPQGSFTYDFVAEPYGIYWYHSHTSGTYDDGVRGPLLIRPKANQPRPWSLIYNDVGEQSAMEAAFQAAQTMMLVNWRHEDMDSALTRYRANGQDPLCLDSILINGQGRVQCPTSDTLAHQATLPNLYGGANALGCVGLLWAFENTASHRNPVTCVNTTSAYPVYTNTTPGYAVLHLVDAGGDLGMAFSIDNHDMWIIAADGEFVLPQRVQAVNIIIGTRYTVLVPLDQPAGDYTIRVALPPDIAIQVLSGYAVWRVGGGNNNTTDDGISSMVSTATAASKRQNAPPSPPTVVHTFSGSPASQSGYPAVVTACVDLSSTCVYHALPATDPYYLPTQTLDSAPSVTTTAPSPIATFLNGENVSATAQVTNDLPNSTPWLLYNGTAINNASYQNDSALAPYPANPAPKGKADYTFTMHVNLTNIVTWAISPSDKPFQSLRYQQKPILFRNQSDFDVNEYQGTVLDIRNGSVVDFIFNSEPIFISANPAHPMHKHQSKVWVLGSIAPPSNSPYTNFPYASVDEAVSKQLGLLNFDSAPRRDGWNVPSGGWVVVRYVVEFPSATLMHCHIQQHLAAGMAVVLREGMDVFDVRQIPAQITNAPHVVVATIPQPDIGLDER